MKRKVITRVRVKARRLYDDSIPDGYMESDVDFVMNNLDVCVRFLESGIPVAGVA